jgi:hypothetical protein
MKPTTADHQHYKYSGRFFPPRLDEQPLLVPDWASEQTQYSDTKQARTPVINPSCRFSNGEPYVQPQTLGPHTLARADRELAVFVTDPVTNLTLPYRIGPTTYRWLTACRPGFPAPMTLSSRTSQVLLLAGVLVEKESAGERRKRWLTSLEIARRAFARNSYASLNRILSPLQLSGLRRHYRSLIEEGRMILGDWQTRRRYVLHNEAAARLLQRALVPLAAAVIGAPLKPSYVYAATYIEGSELPLHVDRVQCEYSISLCIDYLPEPRGPTPWPLCLETGVGVVSIKQALGDGLFYRGRILPHFRPRLPSGHQSTSIFFHYVPESFSGSLD